MQPPPELSLSGVTTGSNNPTVMVPLPNTHQRAMAVRVPGWDHFVRSLLPGSIPLECPDDVIRPKIDFGKVPARICSPGVKPQVLVYAPGCTPLAATGVDATGVWYNEPHDKCPRRSQHRHTWYGTVNDFEHIASNYKVADIERRYLDALKRGGIPPGPLLCLWLVSPPSPLPRPQQSASQRPSLSPSLVVCPFASGVTTGGVSILDRKMMAERGKKRDRGMVDMLDRNLKDYL